MEGRGTYQHKVRGVLFISKFSLGCRRRDASTVGDCGSGGEYMYTIKNLQVAEGLETVEPRFVDLSDVVVVQLSVNTPNTNKH